MAEKKKVVVLLTPGFPKNEQDTTCLPFLQLYVRSFINLYPNNELRVIAFQYPFKKGHYKWNGVSVYSAGGKGAFYSRLFVWRNVLKELKHIQKQNDIAVIHSYWLTECALIGQRFAKKYNIRHIAYAIGQDVLKSNKYLSLLNFATIQVVAMSESVAKRYHELTGYNVISIVPAGIELEKVTMPNEPRTIDIIGVGALTPLKNYILFTEIISILKKDFPGLKALIIGKGEQELLLKEKINKELLKDNIYRIGEIPHNEVFSYMNKSKIFLHTSSYEGQSTVIMEALAMGLTVVCFDVGRVHHAKINACGSKEEMVQKLKALLSTNLDFKPQILLSSEDTVKEFVKVYGL
jgi:glycosyltransferase involved in cell wall biosynthesis